MTSTAWTFPIPADRVEELRSLLAELNEKHLGGLGERARDVGYHQERMWLQPNTDGSAEFIVSLELDEGIDLATFAERLLAYESDFTRWWTPRFESFGLPPAFGEPLLAWDATTRSALDTAKEFIRAVEAKDLDAVEDALGDDAEQLFMHSNAVTSDEGVADLVAGRRRGLCVADVRGREEVLGYTRGIFDKFDPLVWHDHRWIVSPDGEVFFLGTGGMVVARTGAPYRNTYLTRFDVTDGKIVRMAEYGDVLMYARLGVRPNRAELRSLLRAVGRMLSPTRSSRSGR